MGHVTGGPGLNSFGQMLPFDVPQDSDHNALIALEKWVENGIAPDRLIATAFKDAAAGSGIRFQRPIYPYPKFPHYLGGDVNSPASYDGVDHPRGEVLVPANRYLN
jgi:feruloyl esterase